MLRIINRVTAASAAASLLLWIIACASAVPTSELEGEWIVSVGPPAFPGSVDHSRLRLMRDGTATVTQMPIDLAGTWTLISGSGTWKREGDDVRLDIMANDEGRINLPLRVNAIAGLELLDVTDPDAGPRVRYKRH